MKKAGFSVMGYAIVLIIIFGVVSAYVFGFIRLILFGG